jgi:hypothetical protein
MLHVVTGKTSSVKRNGIGYDFYILQWKIEPSLLKGPLITINVTSETFVNNT